MDIAVIGTGSVGSALASGWARSHEITLGSRSPGEPSVTELAEAIGATVETPAAAARDNEVVVLAVPGGAVVDLAGSLPLEGRVVVDPTNVLPRPESTVSLAEQVAQAAPGAAVVKAFNTVGANVMADPSVGGGTATMLLAGDGAAVDVARELAETLGFDPVEAGDLSAAIYLEDMARLWIHLSRGHGRNIAFSLLGA